MFEYQWAEVAAGNDSNAELTRLGADGWEAVGITATGENFGRTYVQVLFKRGIARPALVDVTLYERDRSRTA
ncbi:MAG TPA: hypothetical protein VNB94_08375 [Mycobacteriales bacterium]|nr:hypothetical protein [Mycobacteriales bacterium]